MLALCVGVANLRAYVFIPGHGDILTVTVWFGAAALASAVCVVLAAGR